MLKTLLISGAVVLAAVALAQKQPRPIESRTVPLPEIIVEMRSPSLALEAANRFGLARVSTFRSNQSVVVLRAQTLSQAMSALRAARKDQEVVSAHQNQRVVLAKDFVPNDPYYSANYPSSGWPGQWYLNDSVANLDIEALTAWAIGTGTNIVVGIVDDGVETTHPDLTTNYSSINSYDFGQADSNPNPVTALDNHGTALAGIIAGRGGNSSGITGVMATGKWAGLRVDFDNLTTAQLADAALYRSSGATTDIKLKNHSYGPLSPFEDGSVETNAIITSALAGTIHTRSAGNLRGTIAEDANKARVRNNIYSITVAAINSNGRFADYSSFGSCVFVCAPSGGIASGLRPILTTDRFTSDLGFNQNGTADSDPLSDGAYTSLFGTDFDGGTSVATGLVTGALGIAKGLNSSLDVRMAKHLIVRTSKQVDVGDNSVEGDLWRTNGAGLKFNQNYGFGLLDAGAVATQATQWSGVSTVVNEAVGPVTVNATIPDNSATGVSRTFSLTGSTPMEELQVFLNVTHAYRGDLEAYITSPSGLKSRLFASNLGDDGDNISWTFSTNAFWGESPAGTWTLQVADRGATDTGTWTNYSINARKGYLVRTISGTVAFGDMVGIGPVPTTIEVRNSSTNALLSTHNFNLANGGSFNIQTTLSGAVKVYFITPNWLRKSVSATLNQGTVALGSVGLTNGDPDQSLEVDAADIDLIIANFGNTGSGAVAGDLDWSGEVDAADIDTAIANFGSTGD
ncbi:MAG: S8 family serine peptidase [Chthonomonas sp.]|nr:S8 family serine peptidase [Chthonomonas sp.]